MEVDLKHKIKALSSKERDLLITRLKVLLNKKNEKAQSVPKKLVGYLTTKTKISETEILSELKIALPAYMVPSSLNILDKLPVLPNGKVDRKALRGLKKTTTSGPKSGANVKKNTINPIEQQLISIWEEVLNVRPIHNNDNFFEIGGDSILSIQIIAKARDIGITMSPNQMLENQTISGLAGVILDYEKVLKQWDYLVTIRKGGSKKPLFCIHSGGGHIFFYNLLGEHLESNRPIYALQPSGLDGIGNLHGSIEEMTNEYLQTIKTIQPEGPYNILVYCFSTSVGNEMAIQLAKVNKEINIIVMDTMASAWNATESDVFLVRVKSFIKRFFMSPIKTIKLFLEDRVYMVRPIWIKLFGKRHQKDLERLKANLRKISINYKPKSHPGKVSLILTDKPDSVFQNLVIKSWKNLALGGVKVVTTKGNHTSLFEEPDVRYVSEKIDECIVES